jgi:hypothetical protein
MSLRSRTATELEKFVREWALKKGRYHKVEPFSGPGDPGRDVVGFVSPDLHEGEWDNFQCKQYGTTLPTTAVFHEIGKVLYYSSQGEFTPPLAFIFVAPKGVNRNVLKYFSSQRNSDRPVIDGWKEHCEETIIDGAKVLLTPEMLEVIQNYDFSRISRIGIDEILDDAAAKPVLFNGLVPIRALRPMEPRRQAFTTTNFTILAS